MKDREHRQTEVVKVRDAVVWTVPSFSAFQIYRSRAVIGQSYLVHFTPDFSTRMNGFYHIAYSAQRNNTISQRFAKRSQMRCPGPPVADQSAWKTPLRNDLLPQYVSRVTLQYVVHAYIYLNQAIRPTLEKKKQTDRQRGRETTVPPP